MKKIFTLAIALIAFVGVASAQEKTMLVNKTDGNTIEYFTSEVTSVTFGVSAWSPLGKCTYGEDFIGSFYTSGGSPIIYTYEVDIQENTDTPGLYRLVEPYAPANYPGTNWSFYSYDDSKTYYLEIDATDPDRVWIDMQNIGVINTNYGTWYAYSMAGNYLAGGYSSDEVANMGYFGTLKDGVITFPYRGLLNYLPGYSSSLYYANTSENFKVVLPGYEGAPKQDSDDNVVKKDATLAAEAAAEAIATLAK